MKKIECLMLMCFTIAGTMNSCNTMHSGESSIPEKVSMTKTELLDKIKGGWAGQTLGVTYGGPTEFRYNTRIIPDSIDIPWPATGYCKSWFESKQKSGLYDDIYMDLTFVNVFEKYGLDTPADSFAIAFATADYPLWHANQAARYNILNGIMPPKSGYWKNNPHADDIDFQIESDFAGLMSPGMPQTAAGITDRIGHIMNYGDGWYGGVYVAAMYSLAFVTDDIDFIVREALKMVPEQSDFYLFMKDVIAWSEENEDWKITWQLIEDKWGHDVTCPQGYMTPFNIEAKMNCAYILMGLLYGEGDMGRTVDISTRCGKDSDCNPSNAAGILGTALGYSNIPDYWLNNVREVEDVTFPYTNLTLSNIYELGLKHSLELIEKNGGEIKGDKVTIKYQQPSPVRFEKSYEGIKPVRRENIGVTMTAEGFSYDFSGTGILVSAQYPGRRQSTGDYVALVDVFIDGEKVEQVKFPADFMVRKLDLYWNFDLPEGEHTIEFKLLNPDPDQVFSLNYIVVYQTTAS
ncbi:MAG TPA: ADP-ribosylglycohydrolase family protein [Bacteroidetes bacterium]|nr:ADP-ribosylglycohydrolase family protein [Bacteroidota bacterium]